MKAWLTRKKSPIERYAEERGIELTAQDIRLLQNDEWIMGMVARAQSASMDPNSPIRKGIAPWQKADAIGDTGHHSVIDMQGKRTKINVPAGETPNRLTMDMQSAQIQDPEAIKDIFGEPEPLKRRTPQERLDDVTKTLVDHYRANGWIPDSVLKEISGLYFAQGQTEWTVENLRAVAGYYLNQAMVKGETNEPTYQHEIGEQDAR